MADLRNNYVFSHGYDESGQLYLQHWMWKTQLGWYLHPAITLPESGDVHIADLGCGNGAWLISLAADLEKEKSMPYSAYDVIHIRAFSSVVKGDNPLPILKNAYTMLRPGGYIQWDDLDGDFFKAVPPRSDPEKSKISIMATEDLVATSLQSQETAMNLNFAWLQRIGSLLEQEGFDVVDEKKMEVKKELRSVMTVSLLMIHAHIARIAVRNSCLVGTEKNWEEVWTKAGEEIGQNVSLTMDMVVAIGCKRA